MERLNILKKVVNSNIDILDNIKSNIFKKNLYRSHFIELAGKLEEEASYSSIITDPYWPKWDSPWWYIVFLSETKNHDMIPEKFIIHLLKCMNEKYLHFFPKTEEELPDGINGYTDILCFCALGTIYRICLKKKIDPEKYCSWIGKWFKEYILPDGGYNCDESAYIKSMKSSMVSTLPMLETLLEIYKQNRSDDIYELLQRGAEYIYVHFVYKSSTGKIVDKNWKKLIFPRFYEFDVLRGLKFIIDYCYFTNNNIKISRIYDAFFLINSKMDENGYLQVEREWLSDEGTLLNYDSDWKWNKNAFTFDLLDRFSEKEKNSIYLTRDWFSVVQRLKVLLDKNKIEI